MKNKIFKLGKKIIKPLLSVARKTHLRYLRMCEKRTYNTWAAQNETRCFVEHEISDSKKVSIIVPVYNTPRAHLEEMVFSVVNQHYQNWELILVNASDDENAKAATKDCISIDTRVVVITLQKNLGISANTNSGLSKASGDYIVFLDHDDLIHPCALHSMMAASIEQGADLVYSDEDKVTGTTDFYYEPHCKPEWSEYLLENVNYINHLTMVKASIAKAVGGLRSEYDGAQDYDFLLRAIDSKNLTIAHVPRVLYHWRAAETSTARDISTKTYIFEAGEKALEDHFNRKAIPATTEAILGKPGFYKTIYKPVDGFSIILGWADKTHQAACTNWIQNFLSPSPADNVEIIVGEWFRPFLAKTKLTNIRVVDSPKNTYLKAAARNIKHDVAIVFLSAATPREYSYLAELASVAMYSGADVVQPIIVGPDNTIIDAGLVGVSYGLQPLFKGKKLGENTYFGNTDWTRNLAAITGSVFAAKKRTILNRISDKEQASREVAMLWAHTPFEWQSLLQEADNNRFFNPQLGQPMFEIMMSTSVWDKQMDHVRE